MTIKPVQSVHQMTLLSNFLAPANAGKLTLSGRYDLIINLATFFGITLKTDNLFWNYIVPKERLLCNAYVPPLYRLCAASATAL
jgi:hypothetical protein